MLIVSFVFMVLGVCLFTGFSIFDFIKDRLEDHEKDEKIDKKKKRPIFPFFKDEEDDELENTQQMSLSFDNVPINGQTAVGKKTYNSIEELNNSNNLKEACMEDLLELAKLYDESPNPDKSSVAFIVNVTFSFVHSSIFPVTLSIVGGILSIFVIFISVLLLSPFVTNSNFPDSSPISYIGKSTIQQNLYSSLLIKSNS